MRFLRTGIDPGTFSCKEGSAIPQIKLSTDEKIFDYYKVPPGSEGKYSLVHIVHAAFNYLFDFLFRDGCPIPADVIYEG